MSKNWTARRKINALLDIADSGMTTTEAEKTYNIPKEELEEWRFNYILYGEDGLKTTKTRKPVIKEIYTNLCEIKDNDCNAYPLIKESRKLLEDTIKLIQERFGL